MKARRSTPKRHLPTSPFSPPAEPPPLETFVEGDRVSHDKYGLGQVIAVGPTGELVVDFGEQKARIGPPFSKLEKL
ncbi:hypothetical protein [Actinomadura flavalba]|uniref:hypothetical protein n=1 Tax=Actinomadura flavalba TaxID=1120938 RepID=UPI00037865C1|nr:hypothetical protein [Actinomadura flavalba]